MKVIDQASKILAWLVLTAGCFALYGGVILASYAYGGDVELLGSTFIFGGGACCHAGMIRITLIRKGELWLPEPTS